jgi:hypothetical protein
VSAAFVLKEQTLVPTDDWIDDCNAWSIAATLNTDAYCNLATLIFAKITNMIAKYHNNCQSDVQELWSELQDWRQYRPTQVLPLIRTEAHQRSPFPIVVHTTTPVPFCYYRRNTYVVTKRRPELTCTILSGTQESYAVLAQQMHRTQVG